MSLKSVQSRESGNDDTLSHVEESQTFTQLALYKAALVAVRMINKENVILSRDDLVEIMAVRVILTHH